MKQGDMLLIAPKPHMAGASGASEHSSALQGAVLTLVMLSHKRPFAPRRAVEQIAHGLGYKTRVGKNDWVVAEFWLPLLAI